MGSSSHLRVIGLIDMDCFYAQVEQRENPELWGKPVAVVQPSGSGGALGGIIALSYEARAFGVKRGMMVPQAKALCSELHIAVVPYGEHIDKPDINKYRLASKEVFEVINAFDERIIVEKASVDEAFLDLTYLVEEIIATEGQFEALERYKENYLRILPTSYLANGDDSAIDAHDREESLRQWISEKCSMELQHLSILVGGEVVEQIRLAISEKTKFHCSAGVATNKMMAKLVCARHKPRKQTLLPHEYSPKILEHTAISDIRFLGGKIGRNVCDRLGVATMGQLAAIPFSTLEEVLPSQAQWLYEMAQGLDVEAVKSRQLASSVAVSKQFPGKRALAKIEEIKEWTSGLSKELCKRLLEDQNANKRTASTLILSFSSVQLKTFSKTLALVSYNPEDVFGIAWSALKVFNRSSDEKSWEPSISVLTLSASRFLNGVSFGTRTIKNWMESCESTSKCTLENMTSLFGSNPKVSYREVDAEGWEIYDASELHDVEEEIDVKNGYNAKIQVKTEVPSVDKYDRSFLMELPENIRAEIIHDQRLNEAREIQTRNKKLSTRTKKITRLKKKSDTATEAPPKKKINDFFKKK